LLVSLLVWFCVGTQVACFCIGDRQGAAAPGCTPASGRRPPWGLPRQLRPLAPALGSKPEPARGDAPGDQGRRPPAQSALGQRHGFLGRTCSGGASQACSAQAPSSAAASHPGEGGPGQDKGDALLQGGFGRQPVTAAHEGLEPLGRQQKQAN